MNQSTAVAVALDAIELGLAQSFRNLTLVPLLARSAADPDYITLDEALAEGSVSITEMGQGGTVPELRLENRGPRPVLLLDGEELIGAKQNRVLNLTILAPPLSTLAIPVSCVEAGRWRHVSPAFAAAPRAQFAEGRAARMQQVTQSLHTAASRHSDQGEVWRAIDEKAARLGTFSDTSAMSAIFDTAAASIDDYVAAFAPVDRQAGAIFSINGRLTGLELFDAPRTWRRLAPKLIRSYAVDAIDRAGDEPPIAPVGDPLALIAAVKRSPEASFPAVGLGSDVRVSTPSLTAAALVAAGRAVHVSAFTVAA